MDQVNDITNRLIDAESRAAAAEIYGREVDWCILVTGS